MRTTGVPALDALNARLGADSVVIDPVIVPSVDSSAEVDVCFSRPANIPAIKELYDALHIGGPFEGPRSGQDGDWIDLVPKGRMPGDH